MALTPLVMVGALAVRDAGAKLPKGVAVRWAIPAALTALGVAWIASFAAGFKGWHLVG